MSRLIWIYAVCKRLLFLPMALKELKAYHICLERTIQFYKLSIYIYIYNVNAVSEEDGLEVFALHLQEEGRRLVLYFP